MLIVQYQYINLRYFYCTIANILSNISHEKLRLTIHSLCLKSRKPLPKSMISFGNIFLSVQGLRQNILKSLSIMRLENLCINVFIYLYNKQIAICLYFSWFYWSRGENDNVFSTNCNIDKIVLFYRYSQQDVLGSKQDPCEPNGMPL